ncbi:hypothetical protein TrLO_g11806 [Triparma laevis f. longispina]|uniref:Uncharacterized protein n=1 Tax=Triparma laevis f. longispina TaxID=1714387 RepID=A0A9W7F8G8_9STRA|nr:hypothetical protein TrLO_g11806 [Triparma laevis f. longispina]
MAAENPTTLTTVSTVPSTNYQFMHKPEFRSHFVEFVHVQVLMALRFTTKAWKAVAEEAFCRCTSLTTVSFPTTLKPIGGWAFLRCSSLDNVDLLHTKPQEIGDAVFIDCSELTSMTILDSIQTLGGDVFAFCFKLRPSHIDTHNSEAVVAHLRSNQNQL